MARTFELSSSGLATISLLSLSGIIAARGGLGRLALQAGMLHKPGPGLKLAETYKLNILGSSHDDLATKVQALNAMLDRAYLYDETGWEINPVYLKAQTSGESKARYATVFGSGDDTYPDLFDHPFELDNQLEDVEKTIVREHPWRDTAPGALPANPLTLDDADGPASPTTVHLANFWDTVNLTHVYAYDDSAATFSANLISANDVALFPDPPALNDYVCFGFDTRPGHHVAIPLKTAANWAVTLQVQYWNGAFVEAPEGTKHTRWPTGTVSQFFNATGWWVINVGGLSDWATTALNGQTKYWIKVKITAFTSSAQVPVLHASDDIYQPRTPWFEIVSTGMVGDAPPLLLMRFRSPIGGGATPGLGALQSILLFAKSKNLADFRSHINLGNQGNPGAIAVAAGTDTSFVADPLWPGGYRGRTTFATVATEAARLTITLTNLLDKYAGKYQVYLLVKQAGGTAGQVKVRARVRVGGSASQYPQWFTPLTALQSIDNVLEALDLGTLVIPFIPVAAADSLASTNLVIELSAARTSGSAELDWGCLILGPTDEWWTELKDPLSDPLTGSSALRGDNGLDVDAGVLRRRCVKNLLTAAGLPQPPAETWTCTKLPNDLKTGRTYRFYALMLHGPAAGFAEEPMLATLGCQLSVQVYGHMRFQVLRGNVGV
jgi:hypothetical protein